VSATGVAFTVGYELAGDWDIALLRGSVRNPGTDRWTYSHAGTDRGVMVQAALDGGWILTGARASERGDSDLIILKVRCRADS
jgi:hypothetical protein